MDLALVGQLLSSGAAEGLAGLAAFAFLYSLSGEVHIAMVAPGGIECELEATVQITKITRPLLSVTQMSQNGDITVVCKRDEAVILSADHQVLELFKLKGGLYVADMKARNPMFKSPFGGPAR